MRTRLHHFKMLFYLLGEHSFKRSQFNDPTSPYYIQLQPTGTINHGGLDSEDDSGFSFGKKRTGESNTGSNAGSRKSTVGSTHGSNSPLRMTPNNEDQEFRIKPHAI